MSFLPADMHAPQARQQHEEAALALRPSSPLALRPSSPLALPHPTDTHQWETSEFVAQRSRRALHKYWVAEPHKVATASRSPQQLPHSHRNPIAQRRCKWNGCSRSFPTAEQLRRHLPTHVPDNGHNSDEFDVPGGLSAEDSYHRQPFQGFGMGIPDAASASLGLSMSPENFDNENPLQDYSIGMDTSLVNSTIQPPPFGPMSDMFDGTYPTFQGYGIGIPDVTSGAFQQSSSMENLYDEQPRQGYSVGMDTSPIDLTVPSPTFSPTLANFDRTRPTSSATIAETADGRFKCSNCCDKSFARKGEAQRHIAKHGVPRFSCPVPGCLYRKKGFYRRDKLISHMKVHKQ
ncbi:hypothetical protein MMC17_009875 [Xylographa soralifera]|nr:hypothetical protein [Xylographa soralifera]